MSHWTLDDMPDQTGRTVIVTGANTGLGFETARALAAKGAHVTLACRSLERGQAARDRIVSEAPDASAELSQLDLADLADVRAFAARFADNHNRLDLLILNAGVMVPPESKTAQGFELQFGVNHLGHFALTGELLPLLKSSKDSRVVVVSSVAAQPGKIDFEDLNFETRGYSPTQAYSQSKLANQLFAREFNRRLTLAESHIVVASAHPGWTSTDLQRTSFFRFLNPLMAMPTSQGALPTLRAATDPQVATGDYYGPHGLFHLRGFPKQVEMVKQAHDVGVAKRLWEVSEDLTGVQYGLEQ